MSAVRNELAIYRTRSICAAVARGPEEGPTSASCMHAYRDEGRMDPTTELIATSPALLLPR